mmetsp:Transcript_13724/g.37070  ORF Transcript_13724/g.37070 Transcript_13724/m.37070 type:complete len:240 (-) Transcript_13724:719-1438(-)
MLPHAWRLRSNSTACWSDSVATQPNTSIDKRFTSTSSCHTYGSSVWIACSSPFTLSRFNACIAATRTVCSLTSKALAATLTAAISPGLATCVSVSSARQRSLASSKSQQPSWDGSTTLFSVAIASGSPTSHKCRNAQSAACRTVLSLSSRPMDASAMPYAPLLKSSWPMSSTAMLRVWERSWHATRRPSSSSTLCSHRPRAPQICRNVVKPTLLTESSEFCKATRPACMDRGSPSAATA